VVCIYICVCVCEREREIRVTYLVACMEFYCLVTASLLEVGDLVCCGGCCAAMYKDEMEFCFVGLYTMCWTVGVVW
jgi:hypothetical protein